MLSVMILIIEFACPPPSFFWRQVLLKSATTYFIKKCDGLFLQSGTNVISKCDKHYKVRKFYYKVRQNARTEARSGGLIRTESSKRIQLRLFKQISLVIGS